MALGGAAVVLMAVIGCSSVTDGTATVDASEAPAYRTSVSESLSASAATSSARESERQESLIVEAVHTACEAMSTTSADAIDTLNVYVDSMNAGSDGIDTEGDIASSGGDKTIEGVKIGFFLHTPFPSSEIYRYAMLRTSPRRRPTDM